MRGDNPMIRLIGRYLTDYGFDIGTQDHIEYRLNQITIVKSK